MTEEPSLDRRLLGISQGDEQRSNQRRGTDEAAARAFAVDAARLLSDLHFEDVLILDLRGLWNVADYVLIATGTSQRQIRSVSGEVDDVAAEAGLSRFGRDVDAGPTWVVLDYVDVIVHLFEPGSRAHYDLEMLWGDAPHVAWERQDQSGTD